MASSSAVDRAARLAAGRDSLGAAAFVWSAAGKLDHVVVAHGLLAAGAGCSPPHTRRLPRATRSQASRRVTALMSHVAIAGDCFDREQKRVRRGGSGARGRRSSRRGEDDTAGGSVTGRNQTRQRCWRARAPGPGAVVEQQRARGRRGAAGAEPDEPRNGRCGGATPVASRRGDGGERPTRVPERGARRAGEAGTAARRAGAATPAGDGCSCRGAAARWWARRAASATAAAPKATAAAAATRR